MKTSLAAVSAMFAALATPAVTAVGQTSQQNNYTAEKCYGIAKAGLNDCQTATHACAGTSTKDMDGASWIYVPAGTCDKIAGGSTTPKA